MLLSLWKAKKCLEVSNCFSLTDTVLFDGVCDSKKNDEVVFPLRHFF